MSFVSIEFFALLAGLFIVYFFLGKMNSRYQWTAILIASLIYYCSNAGFLSLYLIASVSVSWLYGITVKQVEKKQEAALKAIQQSENSKEEKRNIRKNSEHVKKVFLLCALLLLLGTLIVLKCLAGRFPVPEGRINWLVMPLGISFFSFLCVGYCVDVYRGTISAETNILKYILYVSFFPHIGQGPIDRYENLAHQLTEQHHFNKTDFISGTERMLIGFFKKLVIANNLRSFVDPVYKDPSSFSGFVLAFATLMYAFQIYADFSGYMDIACGVSKCLGIELAENFRTPYFSKSVAEYWRRWHITLGAWFRDYLYYPVLRSGFLSRITKKLRADGKKKLAQNISVTIGLLTTWLLIGFWHGTSWNYIVHGLYHGTFIILSTVCAHFYAKCREKSRINENSTVWKLFQVIRTFTIVCIGYVLFRADSLNTAILIFRRIVTEFCYDGWSYGLISDKLDLFYWLFMLAGICVIIAIDLLERKESFILWLNRQKQPLRWGILYLFILSVMFVVVFSNVKEAGAGNFIYYNF